MPILPFALLLEVTKENTVLLYSANTKKEYTISVEPEEANLYRELLEHSPDEEDVYLGFDERTEQLYPLDE